MAARSEEDLGVRIWIRLHTPEGPALALDLQRKSDREDDHEACIGGLTVFIPKTDRAVVERMSLDYCTDHFGTGFRITPCGRAWIDPVAEQVQHLLDHQVNPDIAGHGGSIELVEIKDDRAYVRMLGGCQGCAVANLTLRERVEKLIRREVPSIRKVVDATNHDAGDSPYKGSPCVV